MPLALPALLVALVAATAAVRLAAPPLASRNWCSPQPASAPG
jgi:hypothetical protein